MIKLSYLCDLFSTLGAVHKLPNFEKKLFLPKQRTNILKRSYYYIGAKKENLFAQSFLNNNI